jgi:adhesin transport system membrane fusion protein
VQVRTTSSVPAGRQEPLAIIPGMTATVHIQTGEKSFLHYLLKPIIKTREMAFRER